MKHNRVTTGETRLPSAPILQNPLLAAVPILNHHENS